jgi:spermidine synthase
MRWFFAFFFVSGLCSILYEIVWLRLAMAQFGVTTALTSMVLSTFMAGLGLGSWISGWLIRRYEHHIAEPLRYYALTELLIGTSALLVPVELKFGRVVLERAGLPSSGAYYAGSGTWIVLALLPWCACIGATIPLAMLAIRRGFTQATSRSFSYLYLANVLGAVAGTAVPLLLIEIGGFHRTLTIGATLNGMLACLAFLLSLRTPASEPAATKKGPGGSFASERSADGRRLLLPLFTTGLTSMGMEIVWIRQFTPYLGTIVYAFAALLGMYLLATFFGSLLYRRSSSRKDANSMWILLGILALLPMVTANPWLRLWPGLRVLVGIAPFSCALGFVTPMLVDRRSGGDPDKAGCAYAVNIVGCILGPLLAGFLLLPRMGERWVLFVLALPWLGLGASTSRLGGDDPIRPPRARQQVAAFAAVMAAVVLVFLSQDSDVHYGQHILLRDNTATVIAAGRGMDKHLFVNGVGITSLKPVTKMMAHLPLALLEHAPRNALAVCFGMGTTYRSLMSWGISTTAVELVPSVPHLFWFYHADGPELLRSPLSHVVIDDGRRYLERTQEQYDVITVDPPPPVEAAGSSLLYSREFYEIAKRRLRPGGILQQWLPFGDAADLAAVAGALLQSFPYVRGFRSEGKRNPDERGYHFLASLQPLRRTTAAELAQRLPAKAVDDLTEWGPDPNPEHYLDLLLETEFPVEQLIAEAPQVPALQDDRPVNEYYYLRRRLPLKWQSLIW